jgi:hypothetical protein
METQEDIIDSTLACEILGITTNNLRQFVFRKLLTPVGKHKRRSLFNRADVEQIKSSRLPSIPSV